MCTNTEESLNLRLPDRYNKPKMSAKSEAAPAPAEIQAQYNRFKNELQALASKIGELENDIEEHE